MTPRGTRMCRLVGLRTRVATRIAPWLNHPNLRARDYSMVDMVPVPVSKALLEIKGDGWGMPMQAKFRTSDDGRVDMEFKTLYDVQAFLDAWDQIRDDAISRGLRSADA